MTIIVTHVSPDWDALAAAWLLKRFANGFQGAEIVLVNTGNPDPAVLAAADAVVDTGKVFDRSRLRFDHHQWPDNETSAAEMVWEWVHREERLLHHLQPLIELVTAGDLGRPAARLSRERGIHAILSAWKARRMPDTEILERGFAALDWIEGLLATGKDLDHAVDSVRYHYGDDLAMHAQAAQEARAALERHTVYRSADGLLVALENAPQVATFAAMEAGARLVVFHSDYPSIPTVAVGCSRAAEWDVPHVGQIVGRAIECAEYDEAQGFIGFTPAMRAVDELRTFYCHPAGFFGGRGTPKAPDNRPLGVPVAVIAQALDQCWQR